MSEPRGKRPRRGAAEVSTSPIRWDRVDSIARRKRRTVLAAVALAGVALTVVAAVIAFAGKKAIDPSFSPPILSGTSAAVDVKEPRLGRELVTAGLAGASGYRAKAVLEVEGLKGDVLVPHWSLRPVGADPDGGAGTRSVVRAAPITPDSNSDRVALRQWIPMPSHGGRYVSELRLDTLDHRTVADDHSAQFLVLGKDCCRRYETATYVAPLPRGWHLREDYELNPGARHVTLATGPYDILLDIDTSVIDSENLDKSGLYFQRKLERDLARSGDGYDRIGKRIFRAADGEVVVEWSYRLEGDAVTDTFFFRGPSGFAVLGRSSPAHFRETRDLTRLIVRSLEAKELGR